MILRLADQKKSQMTYREDFTLPAELLEQVSQQGLDIVPELIQVIINIAIQSERRPSRRTNSRMRPSCLNPRCSLERIPRGL